MMILMLVAATLGAAPQWVAPAQTIRRIELDPAASLHMVEVVGALGVMTTLQLPDAFETSNVRCGACTLLGAEPAAGAPQMAPDAHNWTMEVRPQERNVHLRPIHVPTTHNPLSLFTTNLFITLDNGQAINVRLRLWDPAKDATTHPEADAAVALHLPQTALISARLAEQQKRLEQDQARQSAAWAQHWILQHLDGDVQCRAVSFAKPYRTDKTVVRLRRLCRARSGHKQTYWAMFDVENDGATPLMLQDATLEPQQGTPAAAQPMPAYFSTERLAFGEQLHAVVVYTGTPKAEQSESFILHVSVSDPARRPVDIQGLVFP